MEKYILNKQTERQRLRREIRKIKQDLRNKARRNRRRMAGAWIKTLSIRATRRRERTPARENSECEARIQIESHGGQSETGGVRSRHASGLGDEGWRRACDSKKGKNAGQREWGQNTRVLLPPVGYQGVVNRYPLQWGPICCTQHVTNSLLDLQNPRHNSRNS